jgi:1,4-dihydroxy-2-naphthoate octaprenyltransferase
VRSGKIAKRKEKKAIMSMHVPAISQPQAWVLAIRPKTLPAAVSPVIVGAALAAADGRFALWPVLAALLGALLLQIGSNLANDYFDALHGADTPDRLGPTRVTAAGLITPAAMRAGMVVVFALSALVGLYLVWLGGWPILVIGVAAILAALAYTGGPKPFGYMGLGDLFVFLFFGPVAVCGTYYLQAHSVSFDALLASLSMGALITAILVVNNLRDIDSDRTAGKYTLAVRWGREGARIEYITLLALAYTALLILAISDGSLWMLAPLLTLPRALSLITTIRRATDGPTLNAALAGTAQLSLLFAIALSLGFLLS